ncbi:MAG: hypothetical protein NZ553_13765 [Caldilinea sp.]|nr:hypothetical protein [Caldilinea sp.]MDW8441539.1 hypothetical protein [Caldilineaceae bacterium]
MNPSTLRAVDALHYLQRTMQSADVAALTRITIQDMLAAFGLNRLRHGRRLLSALCHRPAQRFAHTVAEFDRRVAATGLQAAAVWALDRFATTVQADGIERIPQAAPLLFASNHPGITDTLALFATIPRPDLRTVAAERPFLRALPHMTAQLIFVTEGDVSQVGVVRAVVGHLRRNGAALTFPAGCIEPDPAHLPGAVESLARWSPSIDLFARLAPELAVIPTLVSNVFNPRALHNPLTRLYKKPADRERFAAMLQVVAPQRHPTVVHIVFGEPLQAFGCREKHRPPLHGALQERMKNLLERRKKLYDDKV